MSQRLSSLNLNLLLALDALLDEENVTTAAKRLHVTQPTMSRQLAALRDWFDDPLLVRGRQGLQKTPRAKALALPLRQALAALESAVGAGLDFRPEHTERSFRIAAPDFVSAVVGKPLLQSLQSTAPHATLVFRPLHLDRADAQLDDGEVDFVVGPQAAAGAQRPSPAHAHRLLVCGLSCLPSAVGRALRRRALRCVSAHLGVARRCGTLARRRCSRGEGPATPNRRPPGVVFGSAPPVVVVRCAAHRPLVGVAAARRCHATGPTATAA